MHQCNITVISGRCLRVRRQLVFITSCCYWCWSHIIAVVMVTDSVLVKPRWWPIITTAYTSLPSHLRPTTRECVHLVTRGHFRSRDKDGGHNIRSDIVVMLHANRMALSVVEPELWSTEVLHCGNRDFRPFCSCDLDLDPMTFIYELDPYTLEVHRMCKYELPTSRLSKVVLSDRQTNRQTNKHTDTKEIIYHAASRVVN